MTEEQQEIVLKNIGLVGYVIKHMNTKFKYEDLYDIGIIGLCEGAIRFDKSKGFKESTYLIKCIQNKILTFFRRKENKKDEISLNTLLNLQSEKEPLEMIDLISDTSINIFDSVERLELKLAISKLKDKDKLIICCYYGLYGYPKCTQQQLAKKLGISQSQVCRKINKIILNLKGGMN